MKWQHKIPVGFDDPSYHESEPKPDFIWGTRDRRIMSIRCRDCHKEIYKVDDDEGPETLKAMFRF